MKKVLITGGTGLVGQEITKLLLAKGYSVSFLSRTAGKTAEGITKYKWDVSQGKIDEKAFEGIDTLIHLAGTNVGGGRWTDKYKKDIYDSRIDSTRLLFETLQSIDHEVKTVLFASAIGIYGMTEESTLFTETSPFADDFLAEVTKDWEKEMDAFDGLVLRTVRFRIGVVLSEKSGALPQMMQPIRWGAGAALGSGKQYLSWIHLTDLARMFVEAIDEVRFQGAYNAVASQPVTNKELTKAIAKQMKKPVFLPNVPGFVLKLMLGEMGSLAILGSNIGNQKIKDVGFQFEYDDLTQSLKKLINN
ncbi:MAG: TIGR01777 family protein [Cytophagales bacterium]|nr:TIGR01777 family protein [Cytophagales bacterium]